MDNIKVVISDNYKINEEQKATLDKEFGSKWKIEKINNNGTLKYINELAEFLEISGVSEASTRGVVFISVNPILIAKVSFLASSSGIGVGILNEDCQLVIISDFFKFQ